MTDVAPYVKRLLDLPENEFCADCLKPHPTWASTTLGVFICINCSGIHRNLGTHITLVRSVTLDTWNTQQYKVMKKVGNKHANDYYEARLNKDNGRPSSTDRQSMERFIYDKYVRKLFAADGPPPHISLLMPRPSQDANSNRRNRKIHSVLISNPNQIIPHNEIGVSNYTKSGLFNGIEKQSNNVQSSSCDDEENIPNDQILNYNPTDLDHHFKRSCHPKFARSINSNSEEPAPKKISSFDLSTFNDFLHTKPKNSTFFSDDNKDINTSFKLNQIEIQNDSDDTINRIEKSSNLTRENQKSSIHNLISAVGIKDTTHDNNNLIVNSPNDKIICDTQKLPHDSLNCTANALNESNEQDIQNNYLSNPANSLHTPKFAKPPKIEETAEISQEEEIRKQNKIFEMKKSQKSSIQNLLGIIGIQNDSEVSAKDDDDNNSIDEDTMDFTFENIEEGEVSTKNVSDSSYSCEETMIENPERKRLPKFAKKMEKESRSYQDKEPEITIKFGNARHNSYSSSQNKSSEVHKILSLIQDKTETAIKQNKLYNNLNKKAEEFKETCQEDEIIFYNPGAPEETEPDLTPYPQPQISPLIQKSDIVNDEQLKINKPLPKFAKKKEDTEAENQTKIKQENIKSSECHFIQRKVQKEEVEEEILFINPGIEEEEEHQQPEKETQPNQIENTKTNQKCVKPKSLPKFAKRKEEKTELGKGTDEFNVHEAPRYGSYSSSKGNELFKILNNTPDKREPIKTTIKPQTKKDYMKKESNTVEEDCIFTNPVIEEEDQVKSETSTQITKEVNVGLKPLPKFAKKKDEKDNNYPLSLLNKLDKTNEEPVHLKDIQKANHNKKLRKEKEEELIFVNPGVEQKEYEIQLYANFNNYEDKETDHYEENISCEDSTTKKVLPKFAKFKEENATENTLLDNSKINQNTKDYDVLLFEVLNHLK